MGRRRSGDEGDARHQTAARKTGQLQLVSILAFLFLLPAAVIVAQNATIDANTITLDPTQELTIPVETIRIEPASAQTVDTGIIGANQTDPGDVPVAPELDIPNGPEPLAIDTDQPRDELPLPPEAVAPILAARLVMPSQAVRGEPFLLHVLVENTGSAEAANIRFTYQLPSSFTIVQHGTECASLVPGESCEKVVEVATSADSSLGPADVKVVVTYG